MATLRQKYQELRAELREAKKEHTKILIQLAESAQREAQLQALLARRLKETEEAVKVADFQRFRLNGFQLELEARHYELPFALAILDAVVKQSNPSAEVVHSLQAAKDNITHAWTWTQENKPTLNPSSWVALARKLGVSHDYQSRRVPIVRASQSPDNVKPKDTE